MELQESCDQKANHGVYYESKYDDDLILKLFVVFSHKLVLEAPLEHLIKVVCHEGTRGVRDKQHVNEKKEELLAIPEADTVVNPRTVMVHIEHASVARRAVVATLWLEHVAHEAVATALVFVVTQMEAPEDRHLAWVGRHRLEERP